MSKVHILSHILKSPNKNTEIKPESLELGIMATQCQGGVIKGEDFKGGFRGERDHVGVEEECESRV